MPDQPDPWLRPHFQAGGGKALLYYVVYGRHDSAAPLSRSRYRMEGVPPQLQLASYDSVRNRDTVQSFREGYLWDEFAQAQPVLAAQVAAQDSCTIVRGEFDDPATLGYFRDTIGMVTYLLDHGGVAVYDPFMFRWWAPDEWRQRAFEPGAPHPQRHVVILTSEDEDGTEWLHTRGLRKFGRPELSVPRVDADWREGAIKMCGRFIDLQAFGGLIVEGQPIRMAGVPEGLRCHHRGTLDDPEFNNVHVAIER